MTTAPVHLPIIRDGEDYLVTIPSLDAYSIGTVFVAED
jgi:hypothetical protein